MCISRGTEKKSEAAQYLRAAEVCMAGERKRDFRALIIRFVRTSATDRWLTVVAILLFVVMMLLRYVTSLNFTAVTILLAVGYAAIVVIRTFCRMNAKDIAHQRFVEPE